MLFEENGVVCQSLYMTTQQFQSTIWRRYKKQNRDALPWRGSSVPAYYIMISEFMLQQTQASRVLKKYPLFIEQFPTIQLLAKASTRDVLLAWQGLGYNRRALALHKTAQTIAEQHNGVIPNLYEELIQLSGVGQSTAGAICAFAFNQPIAFIETNIRRVYIYFFFVNHNNIHDNDILKIVEQTIDRKNPRQWYYALMDYGATLATNGKNPNVKSIHYTKQSAFVGSDRQIRSYITKLLLNQPLTSQQIIADLNSSNTSFTSAPERTKTIISSLVKDGIVKQTSNDLLYIE